MSSYTSFESAMKDIPKNNFNEEYRLKKLRKNNDYDIWFCQYNNHYYLFDKDITHNYEEDDYDYILIELNYNKEIVAYYNYYEPNCFPCIMTYWIDFDYENGKENYYIIQEEGAYLMPSYVDRKTDKGVLNILRKHYDYSEIVGIQF